MTAKAHNNNDEHFVVPHWQPVNVVWIERDETLPEQTLGIHLLTIVQSHKCTLTNQSWLHGKFWKSFQFFLHAAHWFSTETREQVCLKIVEYVCTHCNYRRRKLKVWQYLLSKRQRWLTVAPGEGYIQLSRSELRTEMPRRKQYKLQALVYGILPTTTATRLRKVSTKWHFVVVVGTQIKSSQVKKIKKIL